MSRTTAKFIRKIISIITMPMSKRQRKRTLARLINLLQHDNTVNISTKHGILHLMSLKSGITASAIERFYKDEPETLMWIDSFNPGETLWDIGANIGLYSLYAGLRKDITVYAFEPSGLNFGLLIQHIISNDLGQQIKPFCMALGDYTHIGNLHMKKIEIGHSSNALDIPSTQTGNFDSVFSQAITVFNIDDLIERFDIPSPDHIKLDVDGIEAKIIAGAEKTLAKVKSILVEVEGHNEINYSDLINKPLTKHGFSEDISITNMGHRRNRLFKKGICL